MRYIVYVREMIDGEYRPISVPEARSGETFRSAPTVPDKGDIVGYWVWAEGEDGVEDYQEWMGRVNDVAYYFAGETDDGEEPFILITLYVTPLSIDENRRFRP